MSHLPASDHFDIREIAPGVHALIAGRRGTAVSNSAVVDLGDCTLVFDAFQTLQAADDLLAVTRALTGRSAAVVADGLDADAVAALPVPPGSESREGRFRFAGSVRALAARARDEQGNR
jgi:hypothetical protein